MNKKFLTAILGPVLLIFAATPAAPAFSAENSVTMDMEILRQKVQADKKVVVATNMKLTDGEAEVFWPLYDAYQADLQRINQRLTKVINDYALAYNKGRMSNETAQKLLDESIAIEVAEVKLKQSYVPRLGKILPTVKVTRYIQIENKIRALVHYTLAEEIPLIE